MTYKSFTLAILMLIGFVTTSFASTDAPQTCADYVKGTITFKNGKSEEAYIFIDNCNPHLFQSGLRTIDEKSFKKYKKGKKIKKKVIEKYKVKQIQSFILENGREFRQVKYMDLSATTKVGMLPKRFIFEVLADGELTIYRKFYRTQNGFIHRPVMDSYLDGGQRHLSFMTSNFELLFQKDKSKNPRNIRNANLKNIFGDNAQVLKRFQDNDYAFRIEFQRQPEFATNCDTQFMDALLEMVADYNGGSDQQLSNTTYDN